MFRFVRVFIFMLLVSLGCAWLFTAPYVAQAQTEPSEPPSEPVEQAGGSFLGHIVQPGEDLETIAAHYHTSVAALIEGNHLSTPVQLVPGQLLRIRSWDEQPQAPGVVGVEPSVPTADPQAEPTSPPLTGEKWIDVDLSEQ